VRHHISLLPELKPFLNRDAIDISPPPGLWARNPEHRQFSISRFHSRERTIIIRVFVERQNRYVRCVISREHSTVVISIRCHLCPPLWSSIGTQVCAIALAALPPDVRKAFGVPGCCLYLSPGLRPAQYREQARA
jgi:hypothetical protein